MAFYSSRYRPIRIVAVNPNYPFEIGPEFDQDIFRNRNYYLLSIHGDGDASGSERLIERILYQAEVYDRPFTDVIIVSHGWHRRIWQAAGTYDRLLGRIPRLLHSGKFSVPNERGFDPLYVCIHWESETGPNVWSTLQGRPDRGHFTELVRQHCRSGFDNFENLVDKVYEAFVLASAIGLDNSINDPNLSQIREELAKDINKLTPLYRVHGDNRDAVTVLWRCFYDARREKTVVDQKPLLAQYLKVRQNPGLGIVEEGASKISTSLTLARIASCVLIFSFFAHLISLHAKFPTYSLWLVLLIFFLSPINLTITWLGYRRNPPQEAQSPTPLNVFSLLLMQLLCSIPLIICLMLTFIVAFGGKCSQESRKDRFRASIRKWWDRASIKLSDVATYPYRVWENLLPHQSVQETICDSLNSQLSFWKMQSRSAKVGERVADFVRDLHLRLGPKLEGAKIHFVGHSFGASVMANAAQEMSAENTHQYICDTLTLLLGAIDSRWPYDTSLEMLARKRISCVFSKHDSANGFYYPLANAGSASIGYVGTCHQDTEIHIVPPVLPYPLTFPLIGMSTPVLFNVDASLIIAKGNILAGGAHNDIFEDEVMNILWQSTIGAVL